MTPVVRQGELAAEKWGPCCAMRMRRRAHRLNFTSALLTRLAGARRLFRAVCDLEGHVVSPVNASRLPSRTVPRASLGVGAAGWALPRGGLPPPILCQLPGALRSGSN